MEKSLPAPPDARTLPEARVLDVKTVGFEILVVLSAGSEDGLRAGDVYAIQREATYVGQMTVGKVRKRRSVGWFDEKFEGEGAPPRKGDIACSIR